MNNCKDCKYCEFYGRTSKQYNMPYSRKMYNCTHSQIYEMKDKQGYPQNNFVGYGDMSEESPLQLKTRKKFCPLERIKCGKYE